jgi:hypothetical protein
MATVGSVSRATLHPLAISEHDEEPGTFVVGRREGGQFVELPEIGVQAIRLLDGGLTVDEIEELLSEGGDRPDVAGLLNELIDLDFVDTVDGHKLPDPVARKGVQLGWLRPVHVRWLFARPAKLGYFALLLAAMITIARRPDLLPTYEDFFWTDYVGLATLGNTVLFVVAGAIHELMHFAAARSFDLPARIGLGTRLVYLAMQTDVSAAWTLPRRQRFRIYLAGMAWDSASISTAILVQSYTSPAPVVTALLAAYVLVSLVSVVFQFQVFMRTDMYFVLMDLMRCRDLFHDGLRYAGYLAMRAARTMRGRPAPPNPIQALPAKEARAVRIYAPLIALGSGASLAAFVLFALPILLRSTLRGGSAVVALLSGGSVLRAIDGVLLLIADWGLQILFLRVFYQSHLSWFRTDRVAKKEVKHA